jgi:two-component system phosphate regulon response regulator PhoB
MPSTKLSASRSVQERGLVKMKDVVLLAGGNSERGFSLRDRLDTGQYYVKCCHSLKDFCATISEAKIAAILLLFPDEFGIVNELCKMDIIAGLAGKTRVIFISTSSTENNTARSLRYRADEFLIEPVSTDEITKIIDDAVGSQLQRDRQHVLSIGDLALNKETLVVTWRNKKLPLYPLQVHLLEFLMQNPNRPITRVELLNNVWTADANIENATIDRNVKRIRDAFKREAKGDPIRTVRRVGYVFNDQFEQLSPPSEKDRMVNAHYLKRCVPSGRHRV